MWQPLAKDLAIETSTPVFGEFPYYDSMLIRQPSTTANVSPLQLLSRLRSSTPYQPTPIYSRPMKHLRLHSLVTRLEHIYASSYLDTSHLSTYLNPKPWA
jgi:hypothetical protein